jgi:hypothetical protein
MDDPMLERWRNLRADLTAARMLQDAMLIAMTAGARRALEQNFHTLSEQWLAGALAHSQADETVNAVQRSVDHVKARLAALPHS